MDLQNLHYDEKRGYQSTSKLKSKLKENNLSSMNINKFPQNQYTYQFNKETEKPKKYNTINAYHPQRNYQIDIMIYDRFTLHHYKYILVCIDVYSRYLQCRPLTNRRFPTIMKNLQNIFDHMGIPKSINCDNEFDTKQFEAYCRENDVTIYFSDPNEINKNAIVERVNRTIAQLLQKWRTATGL